MQIKRFLLHLGVAAIAVSFLNGCNKSEEEPAPVKVTYTKDLKAIFATNCTPCHLPGGVNPNKWDDYATAKGKITNILDRVQRAPNAVGFMPRNSTTPLSASTIALLKQWQADGLLEN